MLSKFATGLSALTLLFTSACTEGGGGAVKVTGTTRIDRNFQLGGISWDNSASAFLYYTARNRGGQVEVCGAIGTAGPGLFRSGETQILNGAYLKIGEQTIANRIHYFNRLDPIPSKDEAGSVLGQEANCATTGVAWSPGFEKGRIEMVLRTRSVAL